MHATTGGPGAAPKFVLCCPAKNLTNAILIAIMLTKAAEKLFFVPSPQPPPLQKNMWLDTYTAHVTVLQKPPRRHSAWVRNYYLSIIAVAQA